MPNKVVNLTECRDLLGKWSLLRDRIVRGEIRGIAVCIKDWRGDETVVLCGEYDEDHSAALKAAMRMSWALTQKADLSL